MEESEVKIWRVYNNGEIVNETYVLSEHVRDGITYAGYGGDVEKWSEYNKDVRFGCAQVKRHRGENPVVIYDGYVGKDRLNEMIAEGKFQ